MLNLQPVSYDPNFIDPVFGWTIVVLAWIVLLIITFWDNIVNRVDRWASKRRAKRRDRHYARLVSNLATPDFPSYSKNQNGIKSL